MSLFSWVMPAYQRTALVLSYHFYRLRRKNNKTKQISWVVGPDECASMVFQISTAVPDSYSVNFSEERMYGYRYDNRFRTGIDSRFRWWERKLAGPILLGRLMNQARGFIYVGSTGFLLTDTDSRNFEFAYLKKKGLPIVCWWCGSDIRSIKLMHEFERKTGVPNIATYMGERGAFYDSDEYDQQKRRIAEVSSRYATAMFSNAIDHLSYLTMGTEPFLFFLPDEPLPRPEKFDDLSNIVIVHATTSPVIKGTQLVRAAITRLREEGYGFEYVELMGVPNTRVKEEVARAHITMNQFYGFSPTVFGVESLAAGCVVMTSSDEHLETDLPSGSNECWVVTKHHQVYQNLKQLLDHPETLAPIAAKGRAWAEKYAFRTSTAPVLAEKLDAVLAGNYQAPKIRP